MVSFLIFANMLNLMAENIGERGFIRTSGQDFVDSKGNKIFFRGIGLGNWLLPEGYMWSFGSKGDRPRRIEAMIRDMIGVKKAEEFWSKYRTDFITEQDIRLIAEMGFNSVRPALNARLLMEEDSQNPVFINAGFQYIDNLILWCKKYGVYIFLDLHAAPGGQTGKNIDDSANDTPALFTTEANRTKTIELWKEIARRYKDEPTVAGYDLLNEPLPSEFNKYNMDLFPLYKRITAAIREIDKKHMITLEGANWATDWSVLGEPFDNNLFYEFHKYWDSIDKSSIQNFLDKREQYNIPIWVGETGENSNDWIWPTIQLFEDYNIIWSFWPWKKLSSTSGIVSIKPPEGWERITAFSRDAGSSLPAKEAEKILWQYLENIKLDNCTTNLETLNSIFRRVPARVEAENFGHNGYKKSWFLNNSIPKPVIRKSFNVGWLQPGEWLRYDVQCEKTGTYDIRFRMATPKEGKKFMMEINDEDVTGVLTAPTTAGWNSYKILTCKNIKLKAGDLVIRFIALDNEINFDWFSIDPVGSSDLMNRQENTNMLYGKKGIVPGKIEAEHYGTGGEGISYHDLTPENIGGKLRQDAVDIGEINETEDLKTYRKADPVPVIKISENFNVGWMGAGEWLAYDVNCVKTGIYDIRVNLATLEKNKKFSIRLNNRDVTGPIDAPLTGGWDQYKPVVIKNIRIDAGKQRIVFFCNDGGYNLDWISIEPQGSGKPIIRSENSKMAQGTIGIIPGLIEAENYGANGEGKSYHDMDAVNQGGAYRNDGVDIQPLSNDLAAELNKGEWLKFEMNSTTKQDLELTCRLSAIKGSATVRFRLNGGDPGIMVKTDSPDQNILSCGKLSIPAGKNEITMEIIDGAARIDWFELR